MPIYDFSCPHCGHRVEKLMRHLTSYGDTITCPNCNREAARVPETFEHTWDSKFNEMLDRKYPPLNPTNADRNVGS